MVQVRFGGKQGVTVDYQPSDEYLVVRTMRRNPVARAAMTARGRAVVARMEATTRFAAAGVEILRARDVDAQEARAVLKEEADLEFAGRALVDPATRTPLAYTENLFLKFRDDVAAERLTALLAGLKYGLTVKRRLDFARNATSWARRRGRARTCSRSPRSCFRPRRWSSATPRSCASARAGRRPTRSSGTSRAR
jgi:hypothetical protein